MTQVDDPPWDTSTPPKKATRVKKESVTDIPIPTETTNEYAIQFSTSLNGDLVNFRANSAEEFEKNLDEFAEREIAKKWSNFKQAAVAEIIFTNDRQKGVKSTSTATDDSPTSNGGPPSCKHGVMNDLDGKGYKFRYYCTVDTRGMSPAEAKNAKCPGRN